MPGLTMFVVLNDPSLCNKPENPFSSVVNGAVQLVGELHVCCEIVSAMAKGRFRT